MFQKLTAVCTAAALAAGAVLPGFWSERATASAEELDVSDTLRFYLDDVTAEQGEEQVAVSLCVENNPGLLGLDARIHFNLEKQYDIYPLLTLCMDGEVPEFTLDTRFTDMGADANIGAGTSSDIVNLTMTNPPMIPADSEGEICTFYFDVPDDAYVGGVYVLKLYVDSVEAVDSEGNRTLLDSDDFALENGSITIEGEPTSTTTSTTPSTQTATLTLPSTQTATLTVPSATTTSSPDPPDTPSTPEGKRIKQVALGSNISAALMENGDLYMWGSNYHGGLGNGISGGSDSGYDEGIDSNVPIKIMENIKEVSLGAHHCAALTEDGDLYMWGANSDGQLGNGETEDSSTPEKIMENVVSVSLGSWHSAAITQDGDLYLWGDNGWGQLGDDFYYDSTTPEKIMEDVVSVSLGGEHSAAITSDGTLYLWGDNSYGQLGDGTTVEGLLPSARMRDVAAVSLGGEHSAAITYDGTLYMWGRNDDGQLGNDYDGYYELSPTPVMENVAFAAMSQGCHSAAITTDGELWMWGANWYGQLGNGESGGSKNELDDADSTVPIKIMDDIATCALGYNHSAAVTKNGELYIWGFNEYAALGDGTLENSSWPFEIVPGEDTPDTTPTETTTTTTESTTESTTTTETETTITTTTTPTTTTTTKTTTTTTKTTTTTTKTTPTTTKTTTTTTTTETTTATTKSAPFLDGADNWSFANSSRNFGQYYYINDEYLGRLLSGLSRTEQVSVRDILNDPFGGSCYGMACTSILAAHGILDPADYQHGANFLYDIDSPPTYEVQSLINYYFALQVTNEVTQYTVRALYDDTEGEKIQRLLYQLEDDSPVLLTFFFGDYGHAVVAYDVESGSFVITRPDGERKAYNKKIVIYDNNAINYNDDFCMYVNTSDSSWIIPEYAYDGADSELGGMLGLTTDNLDIINYHGYLNGTEVNSDYEYIPVLSSKEIQSDFSLRRMILTGDSWSLNSGTDDDIKMFSSFTDAESAKDMKFAIAGNQKGCIMQLKNSEDLDMSMRYEHDLIRVTFDRGNTVLFDPSGYAAVSGENSAYTVDFISDDDYAPTDWYQLTASGTAGDVKICKDSDGYVMRADSFDNVTVSAKSDNANPELTFTAEYSEVLIYEIDENTIGIAADIDGNGSFETTVARSDEEPATTTAPVTETTTAVPTETTTTTSTVTTTATLDETTTALPTETTTTTTTESTTTATPTETTTSRQTTTTTTATSTSSTTDTTTSTTPSAAFGDVDNSGVITIDDATMTLQVYTNLMLHVDAGVTDDVMKAMDLDEDGAVTIDDATYILAYYTAESVTHTPMTWYEITGNPNAPGAPK